MAKLNRQPVWRQFPVSSPADVLLVRYAVDQLANSLDFSPQRRAEAVLVASELAQNHVNCRTSDGNITMGGVHCGQSALLTLFSVDNGPGIEDVKKALMDGVTTGNSFGNGLGTVRRLADDFAICSDRDGNAPCSFTDLHYATRIPGTMIGASFWWPMEPCIPPDNIRLSAIVSPMPGERFCGDGVHVIANDHITRIVLMDALGHGSAAAESIIAAQQVLDLCPADEALDMVVPQLDRALTHHRGMAALFIKLHEKTGRVETCGIGNIYGCFNDGHREFPVTSLSGVIGQNFNCRRLMVQEFCFSKEVSCVMLSDGLDESALMTGCPNDIPPLFSSYLTFVNALSGQDDAAIIVWKWQKK